MSLLVGVLLGIVGTLMFLALISVRAGRLDEKQVKMIIDEAEKIGSIKYRFEQAQELSAQQLDLLNQAYQPSMSAAHSRYKNGLIHRVEEIEKEKIEIFRTIVKDGVDPYLQLAGPDGKLEKVRMSEAIKRSEQGLGITPRPELRKEPTKKTDSKSPRENASNVIDFAKIREKRNGKSSDSKTD